MPNKHLLGLLAVGPLAAGKTLIALRLRPQPEGWRRTVGVGLRNFASRFALSALGLRPPGDPVTAVANILTAQPAARGHLVRHPWWVERRPNGTFDFALSVEPDFDHRFRPPDFTRRPTAAAFQVVLRPAGDTWDVWVNAHHAAIDGAPLQEMLSALEAAWGPADVPAYPPAGTVFEPRRASLPGEREVWEATGFHDFGPLLARRKAFAARTGAEVSVPALLAWELARRPGFEGARFATTADVPARDGYDRDVGLVPVRPADFGDDFAGYAAAYRAGLELVRQRRGPARELMQGASLLPAWLFRKLMEADPGRTDAEFGTHGLSVLRDARVFVAPMTDVGYPGGFLAVGGVRDGVGPVSAKGTRAQAAGYHAEVAGALG